MSAPDPDFMGIYADRRGGRNAGEAGADPDREATRVRSKGMRDAWHLVDGAGAYGLTVREYRDRHGIHHGIASSRLSNLHAAGHVVKLRQRRDRCGIYVTPDNAGDRPTVPHLSNNPHRVRRVEVPVPETVEVVREVPVEVLREVEVVVEKEVPVTLDVYDIQRVVKRWQEDKVLGRSFGLDGLADGLTALIKQKVEQGGMTRVSAMSRKDYLNVARAVRDSHAAFESKEKITRSLVAVFAEDGEGFLRHQEVFEALALSPERSA